MDRIGDLLHENLYKRFGLPDKMLWDRGPQFSAKAFQVMLKQLGIASVLLTAYYPQTNGTTERVNQEIETYLETQKRSIPTLKFTHNNRGHADQPKTPFKLIMGESPKAIPKVFENTKFPSINKKIKQIMTDWEEALAAHELARSQIAEQRKITFTPFKKGQKVWLDTQNMKTTYHKKMTLKHESLSKSKKY